MPADDPAPSATDDTRVLDVRYATRNRAARAGAVAGRLVLAGGVLRYDDGADPRRSFVAPVGAGRGAAAELVHVHSSLFLSTGSAPDPQWECVLVLDGAGAVVGQVGGWSPRVASPLELDPARLRSFGRRAGLDLRYERGPASVLRSRYPAARFGGLRVMEAMATVLGPLFAGVGGVLVAVVVQEPSWFGLVLGVLGVVTVVTGLGLVPALQRLTLRVASRRVGRHRQSDDG
ncbi:hypothetical protein [Cellulomonas fimi]|uniref:Uncharacterized protein n=1 Tax=Cellulomonas fimi (strain ATCC 484 / DSM 20113 / JCM 1341 / CCUG 24087 / LMG 16345 / NBRC 15513 / NCIMB 8980 / NCTC 7547 / NRS-133) TaxID=590998 RepID=F4H0H9_CELFA|nr:hypothetical protein [Cellulomonas fimi]AEE47348.1 hypothetical protein Celf_3234 [Cellulomonas fimi ATCC 484]NNH05822.1 hypothetical protein [Cellulomonas fimi]VEH35999.1 Uncharacterised protein [Cellulomonas fimi]